VDLHSTKKAIDMSPVLHSHFSLRQWILPSAVLISLAAACSSGKSSSGSAAQRPDGIPVVTARVTQKTVPHQIRAIGTVEPYSSVAVKALVGGELTEVSFAEGQYVNKGQRLFTIDQRPFAGALRQAEANLAKSTALEKQTEAVLARDQAQLKTATAQSNRYASLLESGLVSRDVYDQVKTASDALLQTVEADRAAVDTAKQVMGADRATVDNMKLQLSFATINSPIDGRTGSLIVHRGNIVKANDDTSMVVIHQVSPIYVTFSVPEKELAEVKSYMTSGKLTVEATLQGDDQHPETGTVTFVDNSVDATTGTIKLKATFANRERRLWPGQFVSALLTLSLQPNAVVVPVQAVQTGQQGQYVYVVKPDQTVEARTVVIARTVDNDSIVQSGLASGETVVTDGQLRLVPGAKIKAVQAGATPAAGGSGEAANTKVGA
jgi:membrane fusion protein, multidrug efflux system